MFDGFCNGFAGHTHIPLRCFYDQQARLFDVMQNTLVLFFLTSGYSRIGRLESPY